MKILGIHVGYDEPLWFFGRCEFGVFDQGWVLTKNRVIKMEGSWPTYATFDRKGQR